MFRPYTRPKDQLLGPRWKRVLRERLAFLRFVLGTPFATEETGAPTLGERIQGRVNTRLVGQTLAVLVVLLPALYFWHRFQLYRNSNTLLVQAHKAEQAEKWMQAARLCQSYLLLRPNDADTWVRLARNYDKGTDSPSEVARSIELYRKAITLRDEDPYLRRRLAELYLDTRQPTLAESHADQLLLLVPDDPAGWKIRARSLYWQAHETNRVQLSTAVDAMKKAVTLNPSDALLAVTLADVYRRELPTPSQAQRNDMADEVMNFLVQENTDSVDAHLARYSYRTRYQLRGADDDLDRALVLGPDQVEVLLAAGQRAMAQSRYDEARRYFEAAIAREPTDRRGYLSLGDTFIATNLLDEAVKTWQRGLGRVGAHDLWLNLPTANCEIRLRRLDDAERTLNTLDQALRVLPAGMSTEAKNQARLQVDFVRAKWLAAKERYTQAAPLIRRLLNALTLRSAPEEVPRVIEAQYELAACYLGERQPDLAAALFAQAARLQPEVAAHYLAAGRANDLAGQPDIAISQIEQALKLEPDSPGAWLGMAQARFNLERSRSPSERRWGAFEQALARARETRADGTAVRLLEADYLALQGRTDDSLKLLREGLAAEPRNRALAQALVLAEERWGTPADADQALAALDQTGDRTPQSVLLQVALLARRREFEPAEKLLRELAEASPPEQRLRISLQLTELLLQQRKLDEARKLLEQLYARHPEQISLAQQLATLALEAGDFNGAQVWEDRLRTSEGPDGTIWRFLRATRLLAQTKGTADPRFVEAVRLQAEIQANRPSSPAGFLLKGQLDERRGASDDAIQAYQTAIQLGDRSLVPLERVIALLYERNRLAEADRYLTQLEDDVTFSEDTMGMAVAVAARYGRLDRSLRMAAAGVERRPNEPASHILLGRALLMTGQLAEAEREFSRAAELAPRDPQGWMALLGYYARTGRPAESQSTLDRMIEATDLPEADRAFLMAQAAELLGHEAEAEQAYREAARLAPQNSDVQQRAALFFQRRDPAASLAALRQVLKLDPQSEVGRRYLVQALLELGGQENWQEAWSQLLSTGESGEGAALGPSEIRLQIAALIKTGDEEKRRQAIALLEQLVAGEREVMPEDRILLARLSEAEGKFPRARELYRELVARPNPSADHVAAFIEFLIRNQSSRDAGAWMAQLEVLAPDELRTVELRASWLKAEGRESEIEPMIEKFLAPRLERPENAAKRPEATWRMAQILGQVGLAPAAERWYARAMELAPERFADLAQWLVGEKRYGDAVELCLRVAERFSGALPGVVLCDVLVAAQTPSDLVARAEPVFARLLEQPQRDLAFQMALANLRLMENRGPEAESLYRQVLAAEPNDIYALNNLALVLAARPDGAAEAERLIQQALAQAGNQAGLRDTLGVVLLAANQHERALEVLHPLGTMPQAPAAFLFHLARAYWQQPADQQSARDEARWAWDKAQAAGLASQPLTPQEQAWFRDLEAAFGG